MDTQENKEYQKIKTKMLMMYKLIGTKALLDATIPACYELSDYEFATNKFNDDVDDLKKNIENCQNLLKEIEVEFYSTLY